MNSRHQFCAASVDLTLCYKAMILKSLKNDPDFTAFFHITESVSGESYGTLSSIRPLLYHLLNNALSPTNNNPGVFKQLKEAVKRNLQQCYQSTKVSKLLDFACFLDPCFKEFPFLSAGEHSTLHNIV